MGLIELAARHEARPLDDCRVAATELLEAGRRVLIVDQEPETSRGGHLAPGHGHSVPRSYITWGTGPGVLEPFVRRVRAAEQQGLVTFTLSSATG